MRRVSMTFSAAMVLGGVLCGAARAASPEATRAFQGWTAACNNLGSCVLIGTSADGDTLAYLRLSREAGADAPPRAKIVLGVPDGDKGPFERFALTAVTATVKVSLGPFPAKVAPGDSTYVSAEVAPDASLALIDALRNATTLDIAIGRQNATIALAGLSAALRFVDDKQGRVGGPTALVAKGMTPVGQVPGPRPAPILTTAPAGSVQEVKKPIVTPALLALPGDLCDPDTVKAHEDLKAWTVGPDRIVVALPCQAGAYNFQSALYVTDAKGKPLKAIPLPQPVGHGDDTAPNLITNGDFDPKTMVLSEFAKGRGIGDCGNLTTWLWTGDSFALFKADGIDACPGGFSDDWPNLYTATRR